MEGLSRKHPGHASDTGNAWDVGSPKPIRYVGGFVRRRSRNRTAIVKVTTVCTPGQFEQIATSLTALGRDDLKNRIKDFRGRFKLDFSDDYLDALTLDRLRHILLAALINAKAEP